jgi:hypothetical protein
LLTSHAAIATLTPLWQNSTTSPVNTPSARFVSVAARRAASSSEGFEGWFGDSIEWWSIGAVVVFTEYQT